MSTSPIYLDGLFYRAIANSGSVLTQRPVVNATSSIKAVDDPTNNRTDLELDPSAIDATAAGTSFDLGTPPSPGSSQEFALTAGTAGKFIGITLYDAGGPVEGILTNYGDAFGINSNISGNDNWIELSDVISIKTTNTGEIKISFAGTNRIVANSTGLGFFAATPIAKPTVAGSRGGNAALASLCTALAALGLITDSTTA